eukprot:scaffold13553_cov80-Phaeocystis_antarctica.AAC.3
MRIRAQRSRDDHGFGRAPLEGVRTARDRLTHRRHACWGDASQLLYHIDGAGDNFGHVEQDSGVGHPRAPEPAPLLQLARVEQHGDAAKQQCIHHPLPRNCVANGLQTVGRRIVKCRDAREILLAQACALSLGGTGIAPRATVDAATFERSAQQRRLAYAAGPCSVGHQRIVSSAGRLVLPRHQAHVCVGMNHGVVRHALVLVGCRPAD